MYNVKVLKDSLGIAHITIFENGYTIASDSHKKHVKNDVQTPFVKSEAMYGVPQEAYKGHFLPDEEELQRRLDESLRCSVSRSRNKILKICYGFVPRYFCTFTFSPEECNRYDYDECLSIMQKYLLNLRKSFPDVKYCVVPEKHKDGAYHFHGLFSKELPVYYSGYYRNRRTGIKEKTYHIKGWLSFNSATVVKDPFSSINYIIKYITKEICTVSKGRHRYLAKSSPIKEYKFYCHRKNIDSLKKFMEGAQIYGKPYQSQVRHILFTKGCIESIYIPHIMRYVDGIQYPSGYSPCCP